MDVSVDFKKYKDQLMSLSQELAELAQDSLLHKVNSQQPINSYICDLLQSCGKEFSELWKHLITISKDIKQGYKANVEKKKTCIKRKSNGIYACSVCGKEFTLRPSCYNHLKIHTNTYFCTLWECDYSCKSESTFKEHSKYYHLATKL